ncbi:MAG: acetyltransferase [Bacteroidota bacterium]
MPKSIFILGKGGFASEVRWLLREINRHRQGEWRLIDCYEDDTKARQNDPAKVAFVIAIGHPRIRQRLAHEFDEAAYQAATLRHPSVLAAEDLKMGAGSIVCARSTLTTNIRIGQHSHINLHCTIGHDVVIGDFVSLSPGVHISGGVRIGNGVDIGTGAVVLPGLTIAAGTIIGAGAVVHRNIDEAGTYVGVPARRLDQSN